MEIKRDAYLEKLKIRKNNGMIKVITGIRRCGKSFLLFVLFKKYLSLIHIFACKCKKIVAPAMNTNMYENPVVQANLKKLKEFGMEVIEPLSLRHI